MKILVTATVQLKTEVRNGTTYNQAIHAVRDRLDDALHSDVTDDGEFLLNDVDVSDIHVENLDSEDGGFK